MTEGLPEVFTPMLATSAERPFDSPEYWFEVKWDGVRVLAFCKSGGTRLYSRTHREITHQYPEFADLHTRLSIENAVFDGEIFAPDEKGRPSFELLQQRIGLTRPSDVRRAVAVVPVQMVCFDLPFAGGKWVSELPLADRFERLSSALSFEGRILKAEPVPERGIPLFEAAQENDLEGIVAKQISSKYLPGKRTRAWMKIKALNRIDCVIGGWSPGRGSRTGSFGSLMLGLYGDGELTYIGSVGTGFTDTSLRHLLGELERLEADRSPFDKPPPVPGARFLKPELVCEVEYREMTTGLRLRAPSYKGLRTDKAAEDCRIEEVVPAAGSAG